MCQFKSFMAHIELLSVIIKGHMFVGKSICFSLPTLTRGGRQRGSSPLASYSSGSKATNLLGRWSPYDRAFKCVHQESEEAVWALGCSLFEFLLLLNGHI